MSKSIEVEIDLGDIGRWTADAEYIIQPADPSVGVEKDVILMSVKINNEPTIKTANLREFLSNSAVVSLEEYIREVECGS